MLAITRAANLIFLWLLLFYAMRLGHTIGGPWTGRWSVMLLGFEPNFLAHASLATTDMSLAACLLIFVYYFREGRSATGAGVWRCRGCCSHYRCSPRRAASCSARWRWCWSNSSD